MVKWIAIFKCVLLQLFVSSFQARGLFEKQMVIQLVKNSRDVSDEAYFVNRKITGYLDKAVNKLEEENIDIRTNQGSKHLQQEKTAREAVEDEIKQLVNSFQDAADWDLEERNGYLNRKNKRGWWWCPWCQGSKYILYIAKLFNCKCSVGSTTTCKCPNGKVLTDDRK